MKIKNLKDSYNNYIKTSKNAHFSELTVISGCQSTKMATHVAQQSPLESISKKKKHAP